MKKWTNRLLTIVGVVLILVAIYLFAKPHIDNYLHEKDNNDKIENYDKKESNDSSQSKDKAPEIPKDKSKMAGYIKVPDAEIEEPVYPGPATPEQLNRGVSFAEGNESLTDQNISIAGHTFTDRPHYQFTNLKAAKKGSKVYFKVGNETRKYKMTSIRDVDPSDVKVLDEHKGEKNQLTLITCDNYNKNTGVWEKRKIFVAKQIN
ncbi:MAG: class A sortase SrtA [Staphylococcus warneri]|uniref:Class A sortase SrtA n=1 Tax=Staphylococcus warneri TaxID=1292 RepID=A0A364UNR7_STAWA|nr:MULTISPECIES: class A sortase SrtA [Staphylococcus]MBJ7885013.1 class A sortase SrtA [Bacillaceae bacterium HSR45]MCA4047060.1 class A sortase SrtA [Pseudomonas aeruginosa]MCC8989212.1 class A sortase SrtA [Staphylococcus sp.]PAK72353.1 class A sortase SrtA [Staphylococcus pasteuri]COR91659.1 sortase SrtA [Streptococcus pneumoniae]SKR68165.1 Sortase (surface protein transpeptidase) [Mycobacteroides abscessus subsp. abscessus]